MLDCMFRHPSGVKYTHFWYFMSLLAVLMFASFSPGKTKIYCKVSENSLIFFYVLVSNPRYSISRRVHYPPHLSLISLVEVDK